MLAALACLCGPLAYSAQTIGAVHTGSIPSAGPESAYHSAAAKNPPSGGAGAAQGRVAAALASALKSASGHYRWAAAVSGSQTAAALELASGGAPVMAIGGFNGQGGNITLAQFKQYLANGEIRYYMAPTDSLSGGPSFSPAHGAGGQGGPPAGAPPSGSPGAPAPGAGGRRPAGGRAGARARALSRSPPGSRPTTGR